MKPVKCDPVYLQMARAALIEKLKPRLEPVLSDLGGIRSVSGFKDPEFISAFGPGLDKGFTGHSGRVGMARDLAASGVELPALMTADRWKNSRMPGRYTERQAVGRGALDWYYQERDN